MGQRVDNSFNAASRTSSRSATGTADGEYFGIGSTKDQVSRMMSEAAQPGQVQPIVRDLMKTLLEDHPSLLSETDIENLADRDHTQNTLGVQLGGFSLIRSREARRRGSGNDKHNRFYAKLYAGRHYVCSQWWRDDHLDNARSLLRFVDQLAGRNPNHPGIPELERHGTALREYTDRLNSAPPGDKQLRYTADNSAGASTY